MRLGYAGRAGFCGAQRSKTFLFTLKRTPECRIAIPHCWPYKECTAGAFPALWGSGPCLSRIQNTPEVVSAGGDANVLRWIRLLSITISLIALDGLVWGQQRNTAGLYGRVTDQQAAGVPGAAVTLLQVETG